MQISEIVSIISSVGFPILACMALFGLLRKELMNIKLTIDNNTRMMQEVLDWMRGDRSGKES